MAPAQCSGESAFLTIGEIEKLRKGRGSSAGYHVYLSISLQSM